MTEVTSSPLCFHFMYILQRTHKEISHQSQQWRKALPTIPLTEQWSCVAM